MPRLLATGSNGHGQLGIAHRADVSRFTPCRFADGSSNPLDHSSTRILALESGGNHAVLLLASPGAGAGRNTVWVTGSNVHGELGPLLGSSTDVWTPLNLAAIRRAAGLVDEGTTYEPIAIGCTWSSTFMVLSRCLDSENRLKLSDIVVSFGSNDFGELGCGNIGTSTDDAAKVHIVRLPGWDARDTRSRMEIQHLATGQRHVVCSCLVTLDGHHEQKLYGWGAARHGQISVSSHSDSPDAPVAGPSKTPTRRTSRYPVTHLTPTQLDIQPLVGSESQITHIACGASHTVLRTSAGTLVTLGSNVKHQRDVPASCTAVACTWNGTVGWDGDGVWAVGSNTHGQLGRRAPSAASSGDRLSLGDGAAPPHIQGLVCGSEHTWILTRQGTLYAWGWNEHGNLGVGSLEDQWAPREVAVTGEDGALKRVRGMWAGCGTSWVLVDD